MFISIFIFRKIAYSLHLSKVSILTLNYFFMPPISSVIDFQRTRNLTPDGQIGLKNRSYEKGVGSRHLR